MHVSKLICLTNFLLCPQIVDDGTSLTEIGKLMFIVLQEANKCLS